MSPLGRLAVLVVAVGLVGCSSGDDEASEPAGTGATSGTTEQPADEPAESAESDDESSDRIVLVRNLVTEAEADDALALLAENGFDGFVKQPSSELLPTATDGWDVVRPGLTRSEASRLVVDISADPEVPYAGTIFVDDESSAAESGDGASDDTGSSDVGSEETGLAAGEPGIPSETAVVTIGTQTWTFALSGPEGLCRVGGLRDADGVLGTGRAVDASGAPDPNGAVVTMNLYPEGFVPEGTQSNAVSVDGAGDDADWKAGGKVEPDDVPELADAVVETWTYDDGWATGTATFVLESSIDEANYFDGELVTESGSFEINCR